jgi:excisionase family DNA binding protein
MTTISMTVAEASQTLGVSVETVRRRIRAGDLPGERVATAWGWAYRVTLPDAPASATPGSPQGDGCEAVLRARIDDLLAHVATLTDTLRAREAETADFRRVLLARIEGPTTPQSVTAPTRSAWSHMWARLTGG